MTTRFLVFTADNDSSQPSVVDWVEAADAEEAMAIIEAIRGDRPSDAFTPQELRDMADALDAATSDEITRSVIELCRSYDVDPADLFDAE
jgi:hypothetical protein